jgi:ComF family protein
MAMTSSWPKFARTLLDGFTQLVYPNTCWTCGNLMPPEQQQVCAICRPPLTTDPFATCPRCASTVGPHLVLDNGCPDCRDRSFAFDGALRMGPYNGLLRETILRMKQWTGEDLAEVVAGIWAQTMAERVASLKVEVVIPVPLHWTRRWRRGFNQSECLARALARTLSVPCWPSALRRLRATPYQTGQSSRAARLDNVKQSFTKRAGFDLRDKTVLLVDDVMTTGATVNEAARALKPFKPKAIYVAVLAHG